MTDKNKQKRIVKFFKPELLPKEAAGAFLDAAASGPLAGHHCLNCSSQITGAYCQTCSQKDYTLQRPLWVLLEDIIGDVFAFDSRFMKSNIPLFFKPGKITKEYNSGKRVSFVPPFRQYLIISIIFFICLVNFTTINFNMGNDEAGLQTQLNAQLDALKGTLVPEDKERIERKIEELNAGIKKATEAFQAGLNTPPGSPPVTDSKSDQNTTPAAKEKTNSLGSFRFFGHDITEEITHGIDRIKERPELLTEVLSTWVPRGMIFLVPLFALFLKFFYVFKKRYYIEHLVFSLHFHAFIFLALTIIVLVTHFIPSSDFIEILYYYIPIYLGIALWRNYETKWIRFIFRGGLILFFYLITLTISLSVVLTYGVSKL